jgi:hypothetical protein
MALSERAVSGQPEEGAYLNRAEADTPPVDAYETENLQGEPGAP